MMYNVSSRDTQRQLTSLSRPTRRLRARARAAAFAMPCVFRKCRPIGRARRGGFDEAGAPTLDRV
jgi:hypothetical protein